MALPVFSAAAFRAAFLAHFPTGPIWPRDPGSILSAVAGVLSAPYARSTARAAALLSDAFPATADELLPEWEYTLGLPDPCAGPSPTLQQRRAQVRARFALGGSASVADITAYAADLGYAITITQFAPAVAGRLRAGQPCLGLAWAFAWRVNAPPTAVVRFRAGISAAGEPLSSFGDQVLFCEMGRIAPAHTTVTIAYQAAPGSVAVWDQFRWNDGSVWGGPLTGSQGFGANSDIGEFAIGSSPIE